MCHVSDILIQVGSSDFAYISITFLQNVLSYDILLFCDFQVLEYEYDVDMEDSYKISFLKSFKKQIDNGYFSFIIVDSNFDKISYMEEFWSYAKSRGFQVR